MWPRPPWDGADHSPSVVKFVNRLAGLPAAVLCVLMMAGCSAPLVEHKQVADLHIDRADILELSRRFDCESTQEIRDDVYFFDPMTGVDCVYSDGTSVLVRVYKNQESPGQVLPDWEGLLSKSTQLMVGKNWFAVGDPVRLEGIAKALGVEPLVGIEVPPAVPLTAKQSRIRECSVAAVTITRDYVLQQAMDQGVAPSYEQEFTGIVNFAQRLASAINASGTFDESSFEYVVAAYGSKIKDFCSAV